MPEAQECRTTACAQRPTTKRPLPYIVGSRTVLCVLQQCLQLCSLLLAGCSLSGEGLALDVVLLQLLIALLQELQVVLEVVPELFKLPRQQANRRKGSSSSY